MDIIFEPDGTISNYKTELTELTDDPDIVFVHKPHKKSTVAALFDAEGHLCGTCLEFKHVFIEIKSPFVLPVKICDTCINNMKMLIDKLLNASD